MNRQLVVCLVAISSLLPAPALGAVQVFTDRAAWTAALGGPTSFFADFNGFTQDAQFDVTPLNVGPFSLRATGTFASASFLDVPPLSNTDPNIDGTSYLFMFVDGITPPFTTISLEFGTAVLGFGGDFSYPGNGSQLVLDLTMPGGVTSLTVPGTGTTQGFFGFVATEPVSSIMFHNSVNDGFFLDNVGARTTGTTAVVPMTWGKLKARFR